MKKNMIIHNASTLKFINCLIFDKINYKYSHYSSEVLDYHLKSSHPFLKYFSSYLKKVCVFFFFEILKPSTLWKREIKNEYITFMSVNFNNFSKYYLYTIVWCMIVHILYTVFSTRRSVNIFT